MKTIPKSFFQGSTNNQYMKLLFESVIQCDLVSRVEKSCKKLTVSLVSVVNA